MRIERADKLLAVARHNSIDAREQKYALVLSSRSSCRDDPSALAVRSIPGTVWFGLFGVLQPAFPKQRVLVFWYGRDCVVGSAVVFRIFGGQATADEKSLGVRVVQSDRWSIFGASVVPLFPRTKADDSTVISAEPARGKKRSRTKKNGFASKVKCRVTSTLPSDVRRWLCPAVSTILNLGLRPLGA